MPPTPEKEVRHLDSPVDLVQISLGVDNPHRKLSWLKIIIFVVVFLEMFLEGMINFLRFLLSRNLNNSSALALAESPPLWIVTHEGWRTQRGGLRSRSTTFRVRLSLVSCLRLQNGFERLAKRDFLSQKDQKKG